MLLDTLTSVMWAGFGGGVYCLLWYNKKSELVLALKRVVLAIVVGVLYAQTGFPNSLNTFTAGYFSVDVFEFFVEKYKPKKEVEA